MSVVLEISPKMLTPYMFTVNHGGRKKAGPAFAIKDGEPVELAGERTPVCYLPYRFVPEG